MNNEQNSPEQSQQFQGFRVPEWQRYVSQLILTNQSLVNIPSSNIHQNFVSQHKILNGFVPRVKIPSSSSIVWIFLAQQINNNAESYSYVKQLYSDRSQIIIPICKNIKEVVKFLQYQNFNHTSEVVAFKFVVDLKNAFDLLQIVKQDCRIIEVSLYIDQNHNQREVDVQQVFAKLQEQSMKVFCRYEYSLMQLLSINRQSILNSRRYSKAEDKIQLSKIQVQQIQPTFIELSNVTSSQKTKNIRYRRMLYQAISMEKIQRKKQLLKMLIKNFKEQILRNQKWTPSKKSKQQKYVKNFQSLSIKIIQKQQENSFLIYEWGQNMKTLSKQIIQFYSNDSMFHAQVNKMLRQTLETQKIFQIPFYQLYKSILLFFKSNPERTILENYRDDVKKPIKYLYRGFYCDQARIRSLKKGTFFQILGFISATKNKNIAVNRFTGQGKGNHYIFKIDISLLNQKIQKKYLKYEHGMIDFQKFDIKGRYPDEEEVLINCLNVFQVINQKYYDSQTGLTFIEIKYGSNIQLMIKKQTDILTQTQKDVLKNYEYCSRILDDNIKMLQLKKKLTKRQVSTQVYQQVAQLYEKQGNLKLAHQNSIKTFNTMYKDVQDIIKLIQSQNQEDKQKLQQKKQQRLTLQMNQESNANLFLRLQDYQYGMIGINNLITFYYEQQNWLRKAELLEQKGFIQKGRQKFQDSIKSYKKSQKIIQQKLEQYQKRQEQIRSTYCCNSLKKYILQIRCFCQRFQLSKCFPQSWMNYYLDQQNKQNQKIKQVKQQYDSMLCSQQYKRVFQILFHIQNGVIQIAVKTNNKKLKLQYQRKLQQTSNNMRSQPSFQSNQIQLLSNVSMQYILQKSTVEFQQIKKSFIKQIQQNIQNNPQSQILTQTCQRLNQLTLSKIGIKNSKSKKLLSSSQNQILSNFILSSSKNQLPNNFIDKQDYQTNRNLIKDTINRNKQVQQSQQNIRYSQNPKLLQICNYISYLHFLQNNLQQSKRKLEESLKNQNTKKHTEGAKNSLLLSKIAYSRGQNLEAFKKIQVADKILYTALVKKKTKQYQAIYDCFPLKYQIQLQTIKVYNSQLKQDISLKYIEDIQSKFKYEFYRQDLLIQLFQQKAKYFLNRKKLSQYQKNMKIVVQKIQQQQRYCSQTLQVICMFYIQCNELKKQKQKYLQKAGTISNWLAQNHPSLWIYNYATSLKHKSKNQTIQQSKFLIQALEGLQKKFQFGKDSITYIKFKYLIFQRLKHILTSGVGIKFQINLDKLSKELAIFIPKLQQSLQQSKKRLNLKQGQQVYETDDNKKYYLRESIQMANSINISITNINLNQSQVSIQI